MDHESAGTWSTNGLCLWRVGSRSRPAGAARAGRRSALGKACFRDHRRPDPGRGSSLVTKDDLMDRVWPGAIIGENTLQVHISAVRKALGSDRAMLKTKFGRGYRLLGDWQVARCRRARRGGRAVRRERPAGQPARSNFPAAQARWLDAPSPCCTADVVVRLSGRHAGRARRHRQDVAGAGRGPPPAGRPER